MEAAVEGPRKDVPVCEPSVKGLKRELGRATSNSAWTGALFHGKRAQVSEKVESLPEKDTAIRAVLNSVWAK